MITVDVRDIIRVSNKLNKLAPNVRTAGMKLVRRTALFTRNSAKRHAPIFEGDLKRSIKLLEKGRLNYEVIAGNRNVPYAHYQEFGFTPHHVAIKSTRPKLVHYAERIGLEPDVGWSIFVSKHTPFMRPAVNRAIRKIPNWTKQIVGDAFIKSGFR